MKKICIALSLIIFVKMGAFAQVAAKPEDISPLLIGEKIPNIALKNTKGKTIYLDSVLNKKTVLLFYRGGWCPYCNKQLSGLQSIEKEIKNLGYQVVAISPDAAENLEKSVKKEKLDYQLLSDSKSELIKAVGIAFDGPAKYKDMLLKSSGGDNNGVLPVPTVYVLNDKKEIQFMYVNPNYAIRLNEELLLAALKTIN